jgi:ribosome modulation factor
MARRSARTPTPRKAGGDAVTCFVAKTPCLKGQKTHLWDNLNRCKRCGLTRTIKAQYDPYTEGIGARRRGEGENTNPCHNIENRNLWQRGWRDEDAEIAIETKMGLWKASKK